MNKPLRKISLILVLALLLSGIAAPAMGEQDTPKDSPVEAPPFYDSGCTVIYGTDGNIALGGNNEDYSDPETRIWFLPPEGGKYGRALVGYEGFIWQGGMNDQGLFFDAMSVDDTYQVEQGDKIKYPGSLTAKALESCADVDCVLDLFDTYHAYDTWAHQFLFGDASGNSVIIEPYQATRGGRFQVGTNFLQSIVDENSCRYCDRYWIARSMFENASDITVELMRDILDETHLEGEFPTIYSTIYDLNEKMIYLYLYHNYDEVRVFDLDEELAEGYRVYSMDNLFDDTLDYYVYARTERGRQADIRANYYSAELDPSIYDAYLGTYQGPEDLETLFDYYSVDLVEGELVLKMLPDKAWMKLEPTSETEFFHLSYFDHFEITFLPEETGEVNRFLLNNFEEDHEFERIYIEEEVGEGVQEPSFWASMWEKINRFSGTNTFKFLGIILSLILLQMIFQYLKSLLV